MLQAAVPKDSSVKKAPLLTRYKLTLYIDAEYSIFIKTAKAAIDNALCKARGNTFAQVQHDGATLKMAERFQPLAFSGLMDYLKRIYLLLLESSPLRMELLL